MVTCCFQRTQEMISEIQHKLGVENKERVFTATKAVLHTIRDNMTYEEAVRFSMKLPVLLRGIFFEGYNPHAGPCRINGKSEFNEIVSRRCENINPDDAVKAVFNVISERAPGFTFPKELGIL